MSTEGTVDTTAKAEQDGSARYAPGADEVRVLEAAGDLFYEHGVQAVGMDRIRDASGLSLKRLYQCYPSKAALVEAFLRHRDRVARMALGQHVAPYPPGEERVLAVFDWLLAWTSQLGFRGCVFNNIFGELGGDHQGVVSAVRDHKAALRRFFRELVQDVDVKDPESVTDQLVVQFNGAITVAAVCGDPQAAAHAGRAAQALLAAARAEA